MTKVPLLGVNGSGILHVNVTANSPKVSDPIVPDDGKLYSVLKNNKIDKINFVLKIAKIFCQLQLVVVPEIRSVNVTNRSSFKHACIDDLQDLYRFNLKLILKPSFKNCNVFECTQLTLLKTGRGENIIIIIISII